MSSDAAGRPPADGVRLRVVAADDHPLFLDGISALIAGTDGWSLTGTATTGDELIAVVSRTGPDVVVTDLRMPGRPVIEAISRLRAEHPGLAILVLTMHDDDALVEAAVQAGARGYALKESPPETVLAAITAVSQGMLVLGPGIQTTMPAASARADTVALAFPELTPRERDLVRLVAARQTNLAIARSLGLSEKTVRNSLSTVLAKLRLADRSALIDRARAGGVGPPAHDRR